MTTSGECRLDERERTPRGQPTCRRNGGSGVAPLHVPPTRLAFEPACSSPPFRDL